MKILSLSMLGLLILVNPAFADHVDGYTRSNGTYVQPYERSPADGTVTNNYSYQGNTNPYTGQAGTNSYPYDVTSPNYIGPNSQGQSGHSGYQNPYGQ